MLATQNSTYISKPSPNFLRSLAAGAKFRPPPHPPPQQSQRMQDFQPIPGLAGRIFGNSPANQLRPRAMQGPAATMASQLPVKCPRCNSTNTKFCYYNNYNLSQPRHFCKSCRRYWTKGGVLRNVPVGGGCRKAKRTPSSSKSRNSEGKEQHINRRQGTSTSRSSSDCSTITAAVDVVTATAKNSSLNDCQSNTKASLDPFETVAVAETEEMMSFEFSASFPAPPALMTDQRRAVVVENGFLGSAGGGGSGLPAMDWSGAVDPAMFDFGGGVDSSAATASAFWSQSQWCDVDPSLYLP